MGKNDFSEFSASSYLKEYYSELNPENRFLLSFFHKFYKNIPHQKTLLEVGGGPTIYQLISASRKVDSIIFSEFAESNREEVVKFVNQSPDSWNWDKYIEYELKIERSDQTIEDVKTLIRSKIKKIIFCDIRSRNPLSPKKYSQFDVLSMGSVADSISSSEKEFVSCIKNSFTLLRSKGYFVGFFAKNFRTWQLENKKWELFPIDEDYIKRLFPRLGLDITELTNSVPPDYKQEYEGIFAVSALKK